MDSKKLSDWWYKKTKKSKICSWIDDNIVWWAYDRPKDVYLSVKHWFYCNWNKEHFRLVKQAWCSYGWDHAFLLGLEELQIDKQIKWFSKHQLMVDEQYNEIMRSLRWAKYCIHIMNTDGDELYEYSGDMKSVPVVRDPENGELIDTDDEDAEIHRLDMSDVKYTYKGPKVNMRNMGRFFKEDACSVDYVTSHPSSLYVRKCKHLYYMIRERYTELWWD